MNSLFHNIHTGSTSLDKSYQIQLIVLELGCYCIKTKIFYLALTVKKKTTGIECWKDNKNIIIRG